MSNNALRTAVGITPATPSAGSNPVAVFRSFLERQKTQIAAALPSHIPPERMIRLACTEFAKNPLLQKCTSVSVFGSIIQAAQLGLEIGVIGQAYLVPYRNNKTNQHECQLIPGYKGLIALARRSGEVTSIETAIVYANDKFDLVLGIDTTLMHKPELDGERGAPRLVYGVAKFKDGGHHFEWMAISEVNKIRARSKAKDSGPWVTDFDQMARKTLIRRMANYLPMSIEMAAAVTLSDAADKGERASMDGEFVVMTQAEDAGDAPAAPAADPDTGEFSPEEIADIHAREMAEAQAGREAE
jgi:recombination protein RecT